MKLKKVCAVSLAGLMLLALTGCGGSGYKKAAAPKDGGKKLVMYWGALDDWMAKDIAEFQKETGIKVEAVRMSSGETI